eukprot:2710761-Rhodomonas_salina.1
MPTSKSSSPAWMASPSAWSGSTRGKSVGIFKMKGLAAKHCCGEASCCRDTGQGNRELTLLLCLRPRTSWQKWHTLAEAEAGVKRSVPRSGVHEMPRKVPDLMATAGNGQRNIFVRGTAQVPGYCHY